MKREKTRQARRHLTVGLALFGFFFQLFLPISLAAAAGPGEPNRVLEICAADGMMRVPLPAATGAAGSHEAGDYVEACNHCILHSTAIVLPSRTTGEAPYPSSPGERLAVSLSDDHPCPAPQAGFDARGPPLAAA